MIDRLVRFLLAAAVFAAAAQGARAQDRASAVPLLDVPYIAQSEALCGGAAAAMVMRYWGATGVYAESFADLVNRDIGGIRGDDLLRALETRGWEPHSFRGDAASVRSHLAKRRPVIALLEDRPGRFHYVVVVAWPDERVLLHDPARAPFRVMIDKDFLRAWEAAGFWSMLLLPGASDAPKPGSLIARAPASPETRKPESLDGLAGPCGSMVTEGVRLAGAGDVASARRLFELAADSCPFASGPRREIAGLHALSGAWREAAADARRATHLDPDDQHAWRILATASYLLDDPRAALDGWNRVGEPVVDLVDIKGLDRTRYGVAAKVLAIEPRTVLTGAALERARRRLSELPSAQTARVTYRPGEDGRAQVTAVVIERPMLPTSTPALAAAGVRLVSDREIAIALASPTGGGEVWSAAWRWWDRRPRMAFGFSAPAPFGGVWRLDAFDERQTYGSVDRSVGERRRGAAASFSDWLGAGTRWDVSLGVDRWRPRAAAASIGAGIERHLARDLVVVSTRASRWFGGVETWTASASLAWRSSSTHEGHVWSARTGVNLAGERAPLALWHSAGAGQRADVMLRAHTVLDAGRVDNAVFGRRLVHAGAEWQRWVRPVKRVVKIAPAVFVDIGRAFRGDSFSDTRAHVDVGTGVRILLPGAGVVGVDVGRGLRDGKMALSIGLRR